MRTFRWLVVGAAAALVLNVGSAAAVTQTDLDSFGALCLQSGGRNYSLTHNNEHSVNFHCFGTPGAFVGRDLGAARRQCLGRFKGTFSLTNDGSDPVYVCSNLESTIGA